MIEVVFNESIKGSMKVAKKYKKENMIEEVFESEALGGNSSDVIGICFDLDIGKISDDVVNEERKEFILEMLKIPIAIDENQEEKNKKYWEDNVASLNRLIDCAKKGEDIRIWYSDAPYSLCGFYFINSILKDYSCRVLAIKLPEYQIQKNGLIISYTSWGEIHPKKFYKFLTFEIELSKIEQSFLARKWMKLLKDNSSLRAVVNGKIVSVNEEFYDFFIRINIPDTEFRLAQLVGEVLGRCQLGIGDWWIAQRIKKMIENNELVIVSENDFDYDMVLKRNPNFL